MHAYHLRLSTLYFPKLPRLCNCLEITFDTSHCNGDMNMLFQNNCDDTVIFHISEETDIEIISGGYYYDVIAFESGKQETKIYDITINGEIRKIDIMFKAEDRAACSSVGSFAQSFSSIIFLMLIFVFFRIRRNLFNQKTAKT